MEPQAGQPEQWQRELDLHGRVEVRSSLRRLALLVLLGVVLIAGSLLCTRFGPLGLVVGVVGVLFFGACEVIAVARLATGGKTLVVTEDGAEISGWFRVAWADVTGAAVLRQQRQETVLLRVRDARTRDRACLTRWYRGLSRLNRVITKGTDLALPTELDVSKPQLAAWLSGMGRAARPSA